MGKYRKTNQKVTGGFIPLHTEDSGFAEIIFPNGVRIRVNASDPGSIAQLIHLW